MGSNGLMQSSRRTVAFRRRAGSSPARCQRTIRRLFTITGLADYLAERTGLLLISEEE